MRQELRKPERCPTCEMITYRGESRYYCDGCGKELDVDMLELTAFPKERATDTVEFHFCNWQCLRYFWKQKTDYLKCFDFLILPSPRSDDIEEVFE